MPKIIQIGIGIETLLVVFGALVGGWVAWFPLGGSHIAQLGIVFGLSVVAAEFLNIYRGKHAGEK